MTCPIRAHRRKHAPAICAAYLQATGARWHQLQQEVLALLEWRHGSTYIVATAGYTREWTAIQARAANGRWTSLSSACQSWAKLANKAAQEVAP